MPPDVVRVNGGQDLNWQFVVWRFLNNLNNFFTNTGALISAQSSLHRSRGMHQPVFSPRLSNNLSHLNGLPLAESNNQQGSKVCINNISFGQGKTLAESLSIGFFTNPS